MKIKRFTVASIDRWTLSKQSWYAFAVVLLATFLPLPLLSQSLWLDEASSVWFARLPLDDLLFHLCDPHPPGYYLLLKGWLTFGEGEPWLRLPSLLASASAVVVLLRVGREVWSARTGRLAALLLATFPLQAWYATEVRMYALVQTLGVLLFLPAWRIWSDTPRENTDKKRVSGWTIVQFWLLALAALATDVSALLPYATIQLLWLARGRPRMKQWLLLQVAILVPTALWWAVERGGTDTYHAVFVAVQARQLGLPLDIRTATLLLQGMVVIGALLAVVFAWNWQSHLRRFTDRPIVAYLLLAIWLLLLALSAIPRLFSVKRLLVVLLPYLALLLAHKLASYHPHTTRLIVVLGLTVTLSLLVRFQREPWRDVVQAIYSAETGHTTVFWVDDLAAPVFDYYTRGISIDRASTSWMPLIGQTLPSVVPSPGGTLWLVLPQGPYRDLRAFLPAEFHRQYRLEAERHEPGIGLWRYRRLLEPLTISPVIPAPSQEALWGLQLPSPLAICQ